jgi:hypothetical protein
MSRPPWLLGFLLCNAEAIFSQVKLAPRTDVWTFLAFDIGLAPGATVTVNLTNKLPVNNTYVMMLTHSQWLQWHQWHQVYLPRLNQWHLKQDPVPSSYLASSWRKGFVDQLGARFKVVSSHRDRYHILVLNVMQEPIELVGNWSMVNPGGQELPLQKWHVPTVLMTMSGVFGASCILLLVLLASYWRRGRSSIHFLMTLVLFFKSVVLFLEWCDRMLIVHTGRQAMISSVGYKILDKVQTILELMMFLLISLGWKFLRNSLNITEVRFALGISVVSFYLGVCEVACNTFSTCSGYRLSRYILHSLCYLVVIVAMNYNLQMVGAQIADAPVSFEVGKLYWKHRSYRIFRWIFLIFIIAPTAELFLKVSMVPWDAIWLYSLLQHLRTWVIYLLVIAAFRPVPAPLKVFELSVRDDEDEDNGNDESREWSE